MWLINRRRPCYSLDRQLLAVLTLANGVMHKSRYAAYVDKKRAVHGCISNTSHTQAFLDRRGEDVDACADRAALVCLLVQNRCMQLCQDDMRNKLYVIG